MIEEALINLFWWNLQYQLDRTLVTLTLGGTQPLEVDLSGENLSAARGKVAAISVGRMDRSKVTSLTLASDLSK